ncbi:Phosphatidylinositol 4-kinase gamma, partial [Thalictrum thalictroides]
FGALLREEDKLLAAATNSKSSGCPFLFMSPNLYSPVQTQKIVSVHNTPQNGECYSNKRINEKAAGRRRVFVQTETSCVFGVELDRSDNAHILKRKLQIALNVPAEESSLTFGDLELKNDLSDVRNDSPLLLRRSGEKCYIRCDC